MRPFDLEAAKNGARLCTRDGRPVRIEDWDYENDHKKYIVAVVETEITYFYNQKGEDVYGTTLGDNLMLADDYDPYHTTMTNLNELKEEIDSRDGMVPDPFREENYRYGFYAGARYAINKADEYFKVFAEEVKHEKDVSMSKVELIDEIYKALFG